MKGKFKYVSRTAQSTVHPIILLYIPLGNNLQRYGAFSCNRKRPSTTIEINLQINIVGAASAASCKPHQDSKFSCLVFNRIKKQRFGDANSSGGEMIPIGEFFAVGSPG